MELTYFVLADQEISLSVCLLRVDGIGTAPYSGRLEALQLTTLAESFNTFNTTIIQII